MYQSCPNKEDGYPATCIKRIIDNAFIPFDPANTDYQAFKAWCDEGNTPEPADVTA